MPLLLVSQILFFSGFIIALAVLLSH